MSRTIYVCLFFVVVFAARAQVDTGSISGTVTDLTNAVVQHATIRVANAETNAQVAVTTDTNGFYSVPDLRPAAYSVSVAASGFQTQTRASIPVRVQDRVAVDFQLSPGEQRVEVTVSDSAPLLESETSSVGHVVEGQTIEQLPLNGRNFIQLATLGAGTAPSRSGPERDTFTANGARAIQNSYLLDGVENKNKIVGFDNSSAQVIQPVLDAIEEFKVQTNAFSAEFGQSAGAVVNVTLKSGTNQLHGSAFEFLRNSYFDAKPYFQKANITPQFIQNQFGATAGGPIRRDKTFAFLSWQSTREVNAAPQVVTVPTASQREGIFSGPVYDPATTQANPNGSGYIRDVFPGNIIPQNRWDFVASKLLQLYPAPTISAPASNFVSNQAERIANDQFNARLDHRFTDKNTFFARVSLVNDTNTLPAPLPPPANNPSIAHPNGRSFAASDTHLISSRSVNEFRFGYLQTEETQHIDAPRLFEQYGIIGAPDIPSVHGLPTFAISGLATVGSVGPGSLPTPATGSGNFPIDKLGGVYQFSDNLSLVRGRHTIKIGADWQQVTLYANSTLQARPAFTFNGVFTQNPVSPAGSGSPFADFLLGLPSTSQVSTRSISESRQHIIQGYVQDDVKIRPNLTLNLGLRYELPLPFYETSNHYADLITDPGAHYGTLLDSGQAGRFGYPRSFSTPDYNNLAPRVGFAWTTRRHTVVRSAFGVFYGRDENLPIARRPTNNPPYFVQKTYTTTGITPLILLDKGFPANALDPADVSNPDVNSFLRNARTPYVLEWNFNVQQELGHGFLLSGGYVGSGARKLYYPLNINLPEPGPGAINPRRPIQGFGAVYVWAPFIQSGYNGLLTQLERRFSNGLSVLAAYTWSHSLDTAGANQDLDVSPQNPRNLGAERGDSNFDIRHRVSVSGIYELPFGHRKRFFSSSRAASAIAGGWQLSGIAVFQTGLPFTPVLAYDPSNTGTTGRPNRIADGSLPSGQRDPLAWFNTAAFAAPALYTYGNSGRNILRGPGQSNIDTSLARTFNVRERYSVQFRAEAFNLFNTPQFGLPNAVIGTAAAGKITSVVNPQRELQFALRLAF